MKVILSVDVKHLGEEGDVKDVANGYARNYLFPRNLAVPHNDVTVAYFEGKKSEIEARKQEKRSSAASLKEKLEAVSLTLIMPAGANGKLYGAVTNQTIVDELAKLGFEIERKRVEVPGLTFKSVGKYQVIIHLYETAIATIAVIVEAQKEESKPSVKAERPRRRHEEESRQVEATASEQAEEGAVEGAE